MWFLHAQCLWGSSEGGSSILCLAVPSVPCSIMYHRHAVLANTSLLCAIYWYHVTWFVDIKVFHNSNLNPPPCHVTLCSLREAAKLFSTDTHRHEDGVHTEKWSGALLLKTDNNGRRGGERETHRQRDHPFFFSSSTASLSLPSPCWAWQLSAGSRSICLSLQLSDTQSTWFPMP